MRRLLWMGAAALMLLGACERRDDQALGVERGKRAEPTVQAPAEPGRAVKREERSEIPMILASIQATSEDLVDTAKLAQTRAQASEVKTYASKLVTDHQRDIDDVKRLAKDKSLDVQGVMGSSVIFKAKHAKHAEMKSHLAGLSGSAFDAAFMRDQPGAHLMLAKIADEAQAATKDADVEAFFKRLSTEARDHEHLALAAIPKMCGGQLASSMEPGGAPASRQAGGTYDQGSSRTQTETPSMGGTQGMQRGTGAPNMSGTQPGADTTTNPMPGTTRQPGNTQPGSNQPETVPPSTVPPERTR